MTDNLTPRICPQCGGEVIGRPTKRFCQPICRKRFNDRKPDREAKIMRYAVTRFSNRHLLEKEWDE